MRRRASIAAFAAAVALAATAFAQQLPQRQPSRQPQGVAASGIGRIPLPERPQRSNDQEQETLALQMVESLGMGCRGHEMYRWTFSEDDFPRAQQIVAAGERALQTRGYAVEIVPVEVDTLTAMQARLSSRAAPDANILALWYVADRGVDLTLCRLR